MCTGKKSVIKILIASLKIIVISGWSLRFNEPYSILAFMLLALSYDVLI